jgi:hypothetical protein
MFNYWGGWGQYSQITYQVIFELIFGDHFICYRTNLARAISIQKSCFHKSISLSNGAQINPTNLFGALYFTLTYRF